MFRRKLPLLLSSLVVLVAIWVGGIRFAERTRTFEGTWVDLFEGSTFFEDQTLVDACSPSLDSGAWLEYDPSEDTAIGRMVRRNRKDRKSGQFVSEFGSWPVTAYKMKFVGRKRVSEFFGLAPLLGIGYGHLGASGSAIEVQRVVSIEPIENVYCDVR